VARSKSIHAFAESLKQSSGKATAIQGDVNNEATARECTK